VRVEIEKMLDAGCPRNTQRSFSNRSAECSFSTCWRSIRMRVGACMGRGRP